MWRRTARGDVFDVLLLRESHRPALVARVTLVLSSQGSGSVAGLGQASQEKQALIEVGLGDAKGR
jgi:hypothetical protein